MKLFVSTLTGCALSLASALADIQDNPSKGGPDPANGEITRALEKHSDGARKLAYEQDELSADVQDLIDEQTDPKVIKLLREIEVIMADATDLLEQKNTGGDTIAVETEVIEKIFEAAKQKQQNQQEDGG